MSLIVKPGESSPSLSTAQESREALYQSREEVHALVRKFDEENVWDQIQAKDIPGEMIDYVTEQLEQGFHYDQIRRQLGIKRRTDKAWRKIMAALKQGFRIDGSAHLQQIAFEYRSISNKIQKQIHDAFRDGTPVMDKEGFVHHIHGPTKELAGMIDTYNRLNQGFIANAKALGAYVDEAGKGGNSGVTIVVQSAVQLPSVKDVQAHQEKEREKNRILLEQGTHMTKSNLNE